MLLLKRLTTCGMVMLILALATIGCTSGSKGSSGEDGKGGSNGKLVKFTYLRPTWGPATYSKNGPYEQKLFKEANVQIDVQIIPVIDFDQKINTIFAGGDIPDVVWGNGPVTKRDRNLQDQGAFLKIDKYLDMYPALKAAVPDTIWNMLKDKDGNIYFLPNLIYPIVPFEIYYRQDWFEKLGISEPKTMDELVAALQKIKESDPDGNGKMDTVPFTAGYEWSFKDMSTAFGTGLFDWEPDPSDPNKLIPWYENPKQIDFYFYLQNWYKKGLLDPEFKVNKEPNFAQDRFNAGKAAVIPAHWAGYLDTITKLKKVDPNAKLGVISPLKGPDGTQGGTRSVFPMDRGFYVSAKAKDPDGIFRFLNWTLTDGSDFRRYGVEGKTYTVKDGQKASIPDADREQGYKGAQIEPLSFIGPMSEKLDWADLKLQFASAGFADKFDYVKQKFEEYAKIDYPDYNNPTIAIPTADDIGKRIWNDNMQQVVDSSIINKDVTKDTWNNALKKWEAAGGSKIIDEVNKLQKDKSKPVYTD